MSLSLALPRLTRFQSLLTALLLALISAIAVPAQAQNPVSNGDFESGTPGQTPPGWFVPPAAQQAGFTAKITVENPKQGKQCVELESSGGQGFGNIMQSLDAAPFRGKRIHFRAAVRMDGSSAGRAQLWFRVDRANGQPGFFDNMGSRPITSTNWSYYEIVGNVDADAQSLNFGMILIGGGGAFLDDVTLGTGPASAASTDPPKPLTDRGLQNLVAFTKLFGYIRHFHPSDAVEKADCGALAIGGVVAIEPATDPSDLARRLQAFFQPIAPTVSVFVTGSAPPALALKPPAAPYQVVSWLNIGFGGGVTPPNQNAYHSSRVFTTCPNGAIPAGIAHPPAAFTADLGAGVSCSVPLALYAKGGSAFPDTSDPVSPPGVPDTLTANDRRTRLGDVVLAWNVFQHFYPYFDIVQADWPAALRKALTKAATDKNEREFLDTLRMLVASAKDGHGFVAHQSDDANASPPVLADWVEGKFTIIQTGPGAEQLHPGDVITAIDGISSEDRWTTISAYLSAATDQWLHARGRSGMLAGPPGSSVELKLLRGSMPMTVTLTRAEGGEPKEKRPKPIEELKLGIYYVDLDSQRITQPDYNAAVRDLAQADGIVFDMRGYPNDVAMDVLRRIAKAPITSALWNVPRVTKPDRQDVTFVQSRWPMMDPIVPRFKGQIAFLTDGRVISYAESIMGIVENYKLGAIVGEPTAGTNGNINPFALPGGYTVIFTGMKVLKHDGSQHHGVGIQPTIVVHRTLAGVTAGKDEMLDRAVQIVSGG